MNKSKKGKTMTYAITMNSNGQATIPKAVRDDLKIVIGENRLLIDQSEDGRYYLGREASRREQLESSLNKIHRNLRAAKKKNPELAKNIEKYAGKGFEEVMDAYYDTPEGKQEFKERYGVEL